MEMVLYLSDLIFTTWGVYFVYEFMMHSQMIFQDILKSLRVFAQINRPMFLWIRHSHTRKVIQQTMIPWDNMMMMILFLKSCKIWWKPIFLTTPQQPVAAIQDPTLYSPTEGERFLHEQSQVPICDGSPTCMLKALVLISQFQVNFNFIPCCHLIMMSMISNFFPPKHLNFMVPKSHVALKKFMRAIGLGFTHIHCWLEIVFLTSVNTRCGIIA